MANIAWRDVRVDDLVRVLIQQYFEEHCSHLPSNASFFIANGKYEVVPKLDEDGWVEAWYVRDCESDDHESVNWVIAIRVKEDGED